MSGRSYTAEEAGLFDRSGLRHKSVHPGASDKRVKSLRALRSADLVQIFFFSFLPSLNCISWLLTRSEGFKLHVPSPQQELPKEEVKEDEEAEEGWASSADGHDFTQGAKLLTTSLPPPNTGKQTKIPPKCQTLRRDLVSTCQPVCNAGTQAKSLLGQ